MVCLSCTATGERVCLAAEGFGNRHCFLENIADKVSAPIKIFIIFTDVEFANSVYIILSEYATGSFSMRFCD